MIFHGFIFLTATINLQFIGEQAEAMFGVGYVANSLYFFHINAEEFSLFQVNNFSLIVMFGLVTH